LEKQHQVAAFFILAFGITWPLFLLFFWSLWHIPYDVGQNVDLNWMLANRALHMFIISVLYSWVYNRTKGSILAPALIHPSMNAFGITCPSPRQPRSRPRHWPFLTSSTTTYGRSCWTVTRQYSHPPNLLSNLVGSQRQSWRILNNRRRLDHVFRKN
jgi:hypothetical protein